MAEIGWISRTRSDIWRARDWSRNWWRFTARGGERSSFSYTHISNTQAIAQLLRPLREGSLSPSERRRRLEELLRYVATLGVEHEPLVLDCSRLLYAEARELALQLFLPPHPDETPLPLDTILRQLRRLAQEDPQLAKPWEKNALEITFLRQLVWEQKSEIPAVHTRLALLYAASVQQLVQAESRGEPVAELRQRSTAELREFLELSDRYDMQTVLETLDDALVEERAVDFPPFSDVDRVVENGPVFGGADPHCAQNGRRGQGRSLLSTHLRTGK